MGVSEIHQLKELEAKNCPLIRLVANLTLDKQILRDVLSRKALMPVFGGRAFVRSGRAERRVNVRPARHSAGRDPRTGTRTLRSRRIRSECH